MLNRPKKVDKGGAKRGGFKTVYSLSPQLQVVVGEPEMARPEVQFIKFLKSSIILLFCIFVCGRDSGTMRWYSVPLFVSGSEENLGLYPGKGFAGPKE